MQASGVQAVCWIGACLADALQYPHERGLVHLDVKPSNVLLTADGLPMLLDFHLARECIQPDGPPPEWLGGTPAYMSPEQQSALEALRNGSHVASAVDVRSDIFSLGMLLFELLGGSIPISLESPDLRATLPALPVGLADVLAKCLGKDPKDRYASAADLATDLRRQMSDLPLKGVRNRSHLERWRKWRRRRPHGLAVLGLLAIALTALAAATFINMLHQSQKHDEVRHALETAQRQVEDHQFKEALKSVRRGQDLAGGLLNSTDLIQELELQAKAAEQGQIAEELHRAADHVRLHQGVNSSSVPQARSLEQLCWNIWEKREEIAKRLSLNTDAEAKHRIHGDLLDLAILWTELHIGLAIPQELSSARREALAVLDQAEALFGPSPVLYLKRQSVCEQLGLSKEAEKAQTHLANTLPKTAWEHYSLGRFYLQAGDCEEAVLHFDRAIECEPKEIWAHFYKGMAAYKLNRYQEAVLAFSAFIALGPESAQSYFNRALALDALNDPNLALADYDHVLKLDPTMAPAAFHRGQLHFHQKRYNQALSDYRLAMQNGADQADVYYYMALANQARNDRSAALQDLANCLKANPHHNEAQKLKEKLSKK
jgi:tetratricopeptide (TPR) repeat protein